MEFAAKTEMMEPNHLRMIKSVRSTIKTITTERGGLMQISQNHHLNGTFKQLCNRTMFAEVLFPGTSADVLEGLPKDLKEVLQWAELELDLTKIAKNAAEVLENIKKKGRAQGDIMDETTENVLLPQIGQEALAKGVIEAVRKLSRKVSQMSAKINQNIASTTAPQATQDQLDDECVGALFGEVKVGVQREFLGDDWTRLLRNDILRYVRNEKMTVLNKDGGVTVEGRTNSGSAVVPANLARMCWVEPSTALTEQYAGLAEVISQLHALPYELNLKCGDATTLRLLEPGKGCTMLLHYPEGASQMARVDSRDDGSDLDSGIRITCSYAINAEDVTDAAEATTEEGTGGSGSGGANAMHFYSLANPGQCALSVTDLHDTLVLHQAAKVRNERVTAARDYYVLVFFMQGKEATAPI